MTLIQKSDGNQIFELKYLRVNEIEVNGVFYLPGLTFPIIATPTQLDVGNGNTISNSNFTGSAGRARIVVTNSGIMLR